MRRRTIPYQVVVPSLVLQAETTALLARLTGSPSNDQIIAYDNVIYNLKQLGLWAILHFLRLYRTYHGADSLLNIVQNNYNAVNNGGVWTQYDGYAFNGTNQYIDSGYNPNADALDVDTSDWSYGIYLGSAAPTNNATRALLGAASGGNITTLEQTDTNVNFAHQSSKKVRADSFQVNTLNTLVRPNASTIQWFENNVLTSDSTKTKGADLNLSLYEMAYNNGGAASLHANGKIQASYMARAVSNAQLTNLKAQFDKFFSEISATGNTQDSGL